jgi:transposase
MGAAFSQDIRDRVIRAREDKGSTRQEVAEDLQVSVWYVDSVMKRRRTTGACTAKAPNGGRRRVLAVHQDWIKAEVERQPDVSLNELCERLDRDRQVKSEASMMCRELARMRLVRKKSRSTTVNATPSE